MLTTFECPDPRLVVVVGAGNNTEHFGAALADVQKSHPVVIGEMRPVDPDKVPYNELYRLDQDDDIAAFGEMMTREEVLATYLSTPPQYHAKGLKEHLGYVAAGSLGFVVVTKPAVRDIEEMIAVDRFIKAAEVANGVEHLNERIFTHEHYLFKEEWRVFRQQLGKIVDYLGRPTDVTISIQEKRTIEDERRGVACADGAFSDLAPHAISLGLDAAAGVGESNNFEVLLTSRYSPLERVRDENSALEPGVESGFRFTAVSGVKSKMDNQVAPAASHELQFTLQGGKGLVDEKKITFTFVDESGAPSQATVDFIAHKIVVPDAVAHLFAQTEGFKDNGYGESVARGLKGDPDNNFQTWNDVRKVIKIGEYVRKISIDDPTLYALDPKGRSIETILGRR